MIAKSIKESLKSILGGPAGYRRLTAEKAAHVITQQGGELTGLVIRTSSGPVAIVDSCAVRWLGQKDMTGLMHHIPSPLIGRLRNMSDPDIVRIAGALSDKEVQAFRAALVWAAQQMDDEHNNVIGANAADSPC